MSSHTVARITDPSVTDDDLAWGEEPFVAVAPAPADLPRFERAFAPEPEQPASAPRVEPLRHEDVDALLGHPIEASPNPVASMIAGVEHAMGGEPASGEQSLPRVGIDVFTLQASTRDAADRAAADRRFQRATTTVRPGGVAAAIAHYATNGTPALVVVESDKTGGELLTELDRLAETCDAGTRVVVVGAYNDIALYRELMRRGVSEYLVAPVPALNLIQAITGLFTDPDAPFVGRTVAFVGAKGGVGASAVAHNIGYALSERMGTPAVIVDYDLPFGTAGLDFNQDPLQGMADALSQPDRLDATLLERMMVRCTDKLSLFAAPATLDSTYEIGLEAFEEVSAKIRTTAPFVIMDLPHVWSAWMRQTLLGADDVVIVATPDLASLRNAKNLFDLIRQSRPNDAPPRLVLNQVGVPGRPEIPVKDFASALGVEPSLVLPFDPKTFGQAANNGQMVLESAPRTKTAEGLVHLAQLISRREAPPQRASKSILSGLLKKKSA
jgi:pilus assembly protein CpaE